MVAPGLHGLPEKKGVLVVGFAGGSEGSDFFYHVDHFNAPHHVVVLHITLPKLLDHGLPLIIWSRVVTFSLVEAVAPATEGGFQQRVALVNSVVGSSFTIPSFSGIVPLVFRALTNPSTSSHA